MNTTTEPKQPAERPIPLSQTQLTTIGEFLPTGSTVIGGLVLSYEKTRSVSETSGACVIVIYALDDHTIHHAEMCQTSPDHYEIISDTVVGSW